MIPKKLIYSLIASFSMSLNIFFRKIVLNNNYSLTVLLVQCIIIAALILSVNVFLFSKANSKKKIKKMIISERKNIIMGGILLIFAYLSSNYSLKLSTSINYSFIIKSNLIFVTILAFFFFREKINQEKILLILAFFSGIYLVITGGKLIIPNFDDLLILLPAFLFSSFFIIQKNLVKKIGSEITSWVTISCTALFALILSFILKINLFNFHYILLIFLVGLTEALFHFFQSKTIQTSTLTYFIMMTMLAPIINIILGFFFLNESVNFIQIIGGIILLTSGILVQRLKI